MMKNLTSNNILIQTPKCEADIKTRNYDWFRLDINIRNSELISLLKSRLLSFIRPNQSNIFNIFDSIGLKLLTHLRLGLSHLNEHKFCHNFQDCLNPLSFYSLEIEDITH